MFRKKKVLEGTLSEDQVRLKPILGIRPGVYLAVFYALILVMLLFFLLIYPGLTNPGSVVAITSEPFGAAVRIDDVYMGAAPCGVFIPQGSHRIEIILPGFVPYQKDINVRCRIFGSLIFPLTETLRSNLEEADPGASLLWGASDYAKWSFAGEPTGTYQIPQSLSEGAYRSGPGGASDSRRYKTLENILKGAARFTSTKAALRDLIRAKYIIDNGGLPPSPMSLFHSLEDILIYLSEIPGVAIWLRELLPPETASILSDSAWYIKQQDASSALLAQGQSLTPRFGGTISLGLLTFREISGGTLVQRSTFPHEVPIDAFRIAETEVSYTSWKAFLKANPAWRPEHTKTLITQGLVSEDYLLSADDSSAVPGVSWYAAQAYCQWLTSFLPPALADYEVRLPTEAEWEYAAKAAGISETSLKDMTGGFWEWCVDPYVPNNFLPADKAIITAIGSPERAVRGESWVNVLSAINEETRGSLDPASCSPFGSFRPVIAKKESFHE